MKFKLLIFILLLISNTNFSQENLCFSVIYENAINKFHESEYQSAIYTFAAASYCDDAPKNNLLDSMIILAENCIKILADARVYYNSAIYDEAFSFYKDILAINENDSTALARTAELKKIVFDRNIYNFNTDSIVEVEGKYVTEKRVSAGYYIVLEAFIARTFAEKAVENEFNQGRLTKIVFNTNKQWYYVYSHRYDNLKDALRKLNELEETGKKNVKIHIY